jgi:hypothetical protein
VSTTRARSILSALLLGVAATFGGTGSAQAAIYTGNWDPAYGGIFPELGWSATATLFVPASCLALGNTPIIPVDGACAGVDVLSAQVSFYDVADPDNSLQSFALDPDVNVTGVSIAAGQLAGIDTGFFDYFVPPASLTLAGGGTYSFSLLLYGGNLAQLIYANPHGQSPGCGFLAVPGATCGISANPAVGTFTTAIPEPETYVLMFAGLSAVGFAARRRRR